jgi:hypothetical protein
LWGLETFRDKWVSVFALTWCEFMLRMEERVFGYVESERQQGVILQLGV